LLDKDFIASLFRKSAENFDETFKFLCQIKVVSDIQGKITISKEFSNYLRQLQGLSGFQKREMISEYLPTAM
jgi:hypothetical protein